MASRRARRAQQRDRAEPVRAQRRQPAKIHITVPRAHRPQRATPTLYVVHRADLRDDEITAHEGIPIVTPVRAILDAYAAELGPALIEQAIAESQRRGVITRAQAVQLGAATAGAR